MHKKILRTIAALAFAASVSPATAMYGDDQEDRIKQIQKQNPGGEAAQKKYDDSIKDQQARNAQFDKQREHQLYNARVQDAENRRNGKKWDHQRWVSSFEGAHQILIWLDTLS